VVESLRSGATEPGRDNACTKLAGYFLGIGAPSDVVVQILEPWRHLCTPTFPRAEVVKCVESIAKKERAKEADTDDAWMVTDLSVLKDEQEPDRFGPGLILYRRKVHWLQGEPDTGKSVIAYAAGVEEMSVGRCVLLLDEDAGAHDAHEKLRALGATPEMLHDLLAYLAPAGRNLIRDVAQLLQLAQARRPSLVIVDAAADHLEAAGLDEDKARDVTAFVRRALKPLAQDFESAVVVTDHKTKADPDGRYGRGSGSKLAKTDVAYNVSAPEPFSRERSGRLHVVCTKDKPGWIGRDTSWMMRVTTSEGRITLDVGSPLTPDETRVAQSRPKRSRESLDDQILEVLAGRLLPTPAPEIADALGKSRNYISERLNQMEQEGRVERVVGKHPRHPLWRAAGGADE
jgi:hypothetical protein